MLAGSSSARRARDGSPARSSACERCPGRIFRPRSRRPTAARATRTGIEPLRELEVFRRAREAHGCIYVAAGEVTEGAREFAAQKSIRLVQGAELAKLLPR